MLFNLLMLCDIHNLRELTFITEKEFLKNLQWLLPHCPSELAYLLTLGTQHPLNSCLLRPVFPLSSHISQPGPLGVWACSQAATFPISPAHSPMVWMHQQGTWSQGLRKSSPALEVYSWRECLWMRRRAKVWVGEKRRDGFLGAEAKGQGVSVPSGAGAMRLDLGSERDYRRVLESQPAGG